MDDELEDKILYQLYISHVKIMSKIVWSLPLNVSPWTYSSNVARLVKSYLLRPEFLIFGLLVVLMYFYMQMVNTWSLKIDKLQSAININIRGKSKKLGLFQVGETETSGWHEQVANIAAYAIQGRRDHMEDRFVINHNISNTGVGLFAVFDGHGGTFAANFAQDKLVPSLYDKVVEIKDLISGKKSVKRKVEKEQEEPKKTNLVERRKSFKKTNSTTDDFEKTEITDPELLKKLENITRPITRETKPTSNGEVFVKSDASKYFDKSGVINYGKLITDEILAADHSLLEIAGKNKIIAGTTALIAILEGSKLIVGNVGDSRGVMCDNKGNAIPLSFDHKPLQEREKKRITEAGGSLAHRGVWRVGGVLAMSRAMGDYPLKAKKFVIADPDILTFDLQDHKPLFLILASDGLWDTFSNEGAVQFIKERLHEPDYGAQSLVLQSYNRGSYDNITVIIVNFKNNDFVVHK